MTTRHLVDPEIVPMLDVFPGINLTTESLPQTRAFFNEMNAQLSAGVPEFPDIAVSERHIPGPQGHPMCGYSCISLKKFQHLHQHFFGFMVEGMLLATLTLRTRSSRLLSQQPAVLQYRWTTALHQRHRILVRLRTVMPR